MSRKPKVITLSGSSRFVQIMAVVAWLLERDEGAITMGLHLLPGWYPNCPDDHLAEQEGGASLRAANFKLIGEAGGGKWARKTRPRVDQHPTQIKLRWEQEVKP